MGGWAPGSGNTLVTTVGGGQKGEAYRVRERCQRKTPLARKRRTGEGINGNWQWKGSRNIYHQD